MAAQSQGAVAVPPPGRGASQVSTSSNRTGSCPNCRDTSSRADGAGVIVAPFLTAARDCQVLRPSITRNFNNIRRCVGRLGCRAPTARGARRPNRLSTGLPRGSTWLTMLDQRVLRTYSAAVRNSAGDRTSMQEMGMDAKFFEIDTKMEVLRAKPRALPGEDHQGLPGPPGRVLDLPRQRARGRGPVVLRAEGGDRPAHHQRRHADPDVRGGSEPEAAVDFVAASAERRQEAAGRSTSSWCASCTRS